MASNLNKDAVYRTAKAKEKDYTISDGQGLQMLLKPTGSKLWEYRYSFNGKQSKLKLGVYPTVSLARQKANDARQSVANGINPSEVKRATKEAKKLTLENEKLKGKGLPVLNSFEYVARLWLASIEHLTNPVTQIKKTSRLDRLAFPFIGNMSVRDIKSSDVLAVLKPLIDKSHLETAHRLHSEISSIFAYAIVHNMAEYDPSQPVSKQIPAQKVRHRAGIIDPKMFGQLLRDIQNYQGTFIVQSAFRLSPMLFQRPGEIRQMLWSDVDLIAREWRPYISKTDFHHIVPLSTQVIAILEAIKPLTGHVAHVFPSSRWGW